MPVILIGGVGGTGKTLLARTLMQRLNIPYVCVDHLMMGLLRSQMNAGFTVEDAGEVIGKAMWPFLAGVIKTNIENQHALILEGIQLQPDLISTLAEPYQSQLVAAFIGFSESGLRAKQFAQIEQYRHVVETRLAEDYDLESLIAEHQKLHQNCRQAQLPFYSLDGDYQQRLAEVAEVIAKRFEQANEAC